MFKAFVALLYGHASYEALFLQIPDRFAVKHPARCQQKMSIQGCMMKSVSVKAEKCRSRQH